MRRVTYKAYNAGMRRGAVAVMIALAGLAVYWGSRRERPQPPTTPSAAPVPVRRSEARSRPALDVPAVFIKEGARPQRIAGRVVREGTPVAGATVRLSLYYPPVGSEAVRLTSVDGRFDFGEVAATPLLVSAWAKGASPAFRIVNMQIAKERSEAASLELALRECKALCLGTIRDAQGTPIPRAWANFRGAVFEAEEDGAYEMCFDSPVSPARFGAEGYGAVYLFPKRGRLDVVLIPEATIAGSVSAPDGRPAVGARVSVHPAFDHGGPGAATVTDDAGRFQVAGLLAGTFTVTAETQLDVLDQGRQVVVEAGESAEVQLRLGAGSTLRGVVLVGNAPGAVMSVGAYPVVNGRGVYTVTDENGRFVLGPVPRRPVRFFGAYGSDQGMEEAAEPKRFHPAVAMEEGLVIRFPPRGTIRGRVVRGGKPVARALVSCDPSPGMTFADESGRFTCAGLPAGMCTLSAESHEEGARSTEVQVAIAVGEVKEVDLALTEDGSVSGTVVDERAEPVADVEVQLSDRQRSAYGRANARGEFRAAPLDAGSYSVSIHDESFVEYPAGAAGGFPQIKVSARGANVEGIRLVVKRPRLRTIRGRVADRPQRGHLHDPDRRKRDRARRADHHVGDHGQRAGDRELDGAGERRQPDHQLHGHVESPGNHEDGFDDERDHHRAHEWNQLQVHGVRDQRHRQWPRVSTVVGGHADGVILAAIPACGRAQPPVPPRTRTASRFRSSATPAGRRRTTSRPRSRRAT